ncbi:N-acylneuraminate cytidylyltransferase [Flavobacterium longum]|uniref:acylneuraminate cytidylyltransferase family protein n=1 Tax=Flavobacterium longum TaxID=1299340 RepID=UPI0039E92A12
MKVLGLIPARGGSKGVPNKNIKLLGEKPLIAYSIASAKAAASLAQTIVSTDSEAIFSVAAQYGVQPPFLRPEALARDHSTSLEVVQHALSFYEDQGVFFDAVCLLQPTSPFREKGFIDRAIQVFAASGADSLVSVLPVPHEYNPHWVFEPGADGFLTIATGDEKIIPRRQALPAAFHRDGSVYISKAEVIKNGSLFGKRIAYCENDPALYVNIDTPKDWATAETMACDHKIIALLDL